LANQHIRVLEIQDLSKKIYTIDVLEYLFRKFPQKKFIWLMGADTLLNFHLWRDWKKIFYNIPIAIFDRPFYSLSISKAKATLHFKEDKISSKLSRYLKFMKTPSWSFISGLTHLQSSTKIRQKKVESP
jgi:nicotinate-nucleotide adenylyltransferase